MPFTLFALSMLLWLAAFIESEQPKPGRRLMAICLLGCGVAADAALIGLIA